MGGAVTATPRPADLAGRRDDAARANDVFAGFYDDFTRDHDHAAWTGALERLALGAGLAGRRLLDLACGTGGSFVAMLERGYAVTACDVSAAMVAVARDKARGRAGVLVADVRALPELGEFDLVWCLGDALNYLQTEAELTAAFAGVRTNLAPGGVFVFDLNTLATFRGLHSSLRVSPAPERVLVFDGRGPSDLEPGGAAEVWIERLSAGENGCWRRERSVHRHRHHPAARIQRCLRDAGLEPAGVFGSVSTGALEPAVDETRHVKAVYLARPYAPDSEGRR
jgi:SAM-dependent methyltransferase